MEDIRSLPGESAALLPLKAPVGRKQVLRSGHSSLLMARRHTDLQDLCLNSVCAWTICIYMCACTVFQCTNKCVYYIPYVCKCNLYL